MSSQFDSGLCLMPRLFFYVAKTSARRERRDHEIRRDESSHDASSSRFSLVSSRPRYHRFKGEGSEEEAAET